MSLPYEFLVLDKTLFPKLDFFLEKAKTWTLSVPVMKHRRYNIRTHERFTQNLASSHVSYASTERVLFVI